MRKQGIAGAAPHAGTEEIPHIIHQIWKNEQIPDLWLDFAHSWKRFNPEWDYRLWTDEAVRSFVGERYPELLKIYDAFSYDIQRADFARYLILHGCGGLYADLDMECLRPVSELLAGRSFVVCHEPQKHARTKGFETMVCNAFMCSVPAHPFLGAVIEALATGPTAITTHLEVLTSTGPLMLTRIMNEYGQSDVTILGAEVASPLESDSTRLETLLQGEDSAAGIKAELVENGSYAIHYWSNSWGRNLAGNLKNPHPHHIDGYQFYPGWDSAGFDIKNGGRNIAMLARECDRMEGAAGFNTDGFIKYRLRPWFRWTRIHARTDHAWSRWTGANRQCDNEGLYVKKSRRPLFRASLLLRLLETAARLREWLGQGRLRLPRSGQR